MKLSPDQIKKIKDLIDTLFDSTKARLQGRFFKGSSIYFQVIREVSPMDTIEGIYHHTLNILYGAGVKPDPDTIAHLNEITGNYIDAQRLKVRNHIFADIANAKTQEQAMKAVKGHFDKSTKYVDMLVANETKLVQAYANREGISHLAADMGIKDPTLAWLGKVDTKLCKNCKEMYHDPSNLWRPRPWKLSQLRDGYFKPKEWDGESVYHNAHVRCRHSSTMCPPGYGFDSTGRITFVALDYDYYNDYHGIKKSESSPEIKQLAPGDFFMDYDEFLKNYDNLHDHDHSE